MTCLCHDTSLASSSATLAAAPALPPAGVPPSPSSPAPAARPPSPPSLEGGAPAPPPAPPLGGSGADARLARPARPCCPSPAGPAPPPDLLPSSGGRCTRLLGRPSTEGTGELLVGAGELPLGPRSRPKPVDLNPGGFPLGSAAAGSAEGAAGCGLGAPPLAVSRSEANWERALRRYRCTSCVAMCAASLMIFSASEGPWSRARCFCATTRTK